MLEETGRESSAESGLQTPVQFVPCVGPGRAALLEKLGIRTAFDLLMHVPGSVNDFSDMRSPEKLEAEIDQSVHGTVVDRDYRQLKGGRTMVGILLDCEGNYVRGTWFNQPWMLKKFRDGDHVIFSGKPRRRSGRWEFGHPRIHWLDDEQVEDIDGAVGVLPRYRLTEGIKMDAMRRMTREAVERFADLMIEPLPEYYRKHHELPDASTAMRWLHTPESKTQFDAGRRRVILDDLFEFQLGLALRRRFWGARATAWSIPVSAKVDARIRRLFAFRFTKGQDAAIKDLKEDLELTQPMHRLLQADVGAGKTVIAIYALLAAVAAGYQAVLMAPTEVLASQHWETLQELLVNSRVKSGFLVGGLSAAQRRDLLADIQSGACQIIVGTQAVIQDTVKFRNLAVAIIDEQHRFGVRQRAAFGSTEESSAMQPHVLVMTATPIPRSLCLTRFGDLDISTIRELPPGRQKVITSLIQEKKELQRCWEFVLGQVRNGRQAYVVCPRVEGQTDEDDAAAESVFERLQQSELKGVRVGLLHGRMDRGVRHELMDQFRDREIDVLVSTTVIEVGVNVPNATVMVIQQAERFGLAQLHQLRGRICRGQFQGYCFLLSDSETPEATERLEAVTESSDGFQLAERDAEIRGPGDVLGTRQSGAMPLRVADPVRDLSTLQVARRMAHDLVRTGDFDSKEYAVLKRMVIDRFADVLDLPQTG